MKTREGAHGAGQPDPRSLPRPSPSANSVGDWKGDPLGPQVAAPTFTPLKQDGASAWSRCACALLRTHVATTNIVLNWANRTEAHNFDAKLSSITVHSRDGFAFNIDVSQIIHGGALDAPKVISRVGSMQNLVDHVLQPIVGNYFRNSAQDFTVLDFLSARSHRQTDAAGHIRIALRAYDVQAIDTLIGDINPPAELMQTQTERKIAEEQRKTYEVQEAAQHQRQQLVRGTALADIQSKVVAAEQGVDIARLQSDAHIRQATGEAEAGVAGRWRRRECRGDDGLSPRG